LITELKETNVRGNKMAEMSGNKQQKKPCGYKGRDDTM
jgi:hypothetical protein